MSDLVAEVMQVVLAVSIVSTVVRNAAQVYLLVFYLWWRYKKEKCGIEIVNRVLGDHDDETTE